MDIVTEVAADRTKKVVVIANTPYPNSIPISADTVLVTFATTPDNMEATAGVPVWRNSPRG